MRTILAILLVIFLGETVASELSDALNKKQGPHIATESECKEARGEWRMNGQSRIYFCAAPTTDGGKSCSTQTDCEGLCLATLDASAHYLVFRCAASYYPGECFTPVISGQVGSVICE